MESKLYRLVSGVSEVLRRRTRRRYRRSIKRSLRWAYLRLCFTIIKAALRGQQEVVMLGVWWRATLSCEHLYLYLFMRRHASFDVVFNYEVADAPNDAGAFSTGRTLWKRIRGTEVSLASLPHGLCFVRITW